MNIALDENVPEKVEMKYILEGHIIVYRAPPGSRDEDWVEEAVCRGADIIISRDYDIPNILDRNGWNDIQWRKK